MILPIIAQDVLHIKDQVHILIVVILNTILMDPAHVVNVWSKWSVLMTVMIIVVGGNPNQSMKRN